jgi:hypothetical protein
MTIDAIAIDTGALEHFAAKLLALATVEARRGDEHNRKIHTALAAEFSAMFSLDAERVKQRADRTLRNAEARAHAAMN